MNKIIIGYTDGAHFYKYFIKSIFYNMFPEKQCIFMKNPLVEPNYLVLSTDGDQHQKFKDAYKILIKTKIGSLQTYKVDLIIDTVNDTKHLPDKTKMIYIPYYVLSFQERFQNGPNHLIKSKSYNPKEILKTKTKFCAFLYHNCEIKYRNKFFFILNKYKKVDALGTCLGKPSKEEYDRFFFKDKEASYHDRAVQKYKPYKFVICFESNKKNGYISEKIVNAMLANCIPIYYGADDVTEHFNEKCFVNANKFSEFEECVKFIKEIDNDKSLYLKMLKENWIKTNKLTPWFNLNNFVKVMKPILHNK